MVGFDMPFEGDSSETHEDTSQEASVFPQQDRAFGSESDVAAVVKEEHSETSTGSPETETGAGRNVGESTEVQEKPIRKLKVRKEKAIEDTRESKQEDKDEQTPASRKTARGSSKKEKKGKATEEVVRTKEPKRFFLSIADLSQDEHYVPGANKKWYVLKVQVNREDAIKEALRRRVGIAGYEVYFDEILIPTEKITEVRNGKKRIVKKKLYPGYLMINMEINEETWFLVRETSGIGDFTGATGKPTPMLEHEIQAMLRTEDDAVEAAPNLKIPYQVGDRIKVKEGTFENFEGEVHQIDLGSGRVTVMINIFGRSTPVELEYWQIEIVD